MKKVLATAFLTCVVLVVALAIAVVVPIWQQGYGLYMQAVTQQSIAKRIIAMQESENYIAIDRISNKYIQMVVQSEDGRFYTHKGIDILSICRAMLANINAGKYIEGGSTITQQLAKNMCFSSEKSYERKIAEMLVAFELEEILTKDEILELYFNIAYFGEDCYGIKQASMHYYGIEPIALNNLQAQVLTKTLKSPNTFNPNVDELAA